MTVETVLLAAMIETWLLTIVRGRRKIAQVWQEASGLEKCGLLLFLVPLPGPVDNIISGLVFVRVWRRMARS